MSYDYLLVRGGPDEETAAFLGELEGYEAALMSVWSAAMSNAIGPIEDVKARISSMFSSLCWTKSSPPITSAMAQSSPITDWSWSALGGPELTLGTDEAGMVRAISMSHAEHAEVEQLALTLRLRALDEQTGEVFGAEL